MEIEALEALAPSVALAISRALLSLDLKEKARQVMQSEKLAALGEMAASFVHEIRNPLGIILGSVETLEQKNFRFRSPGDAGLHPRGIGADQ